ncbi:MAG: HAD family hydrolase [Christensenellales bacterium]
MAMQKLAIFDFDGTLIHGDSIARYVLYAVRRGWLSPFRLPCQLLNVRRTLTRKISDEQGKTNALAFLGGMDKKQQETFNLSFCRDHLSPLLYSKGIARMREHQARGDRVLLLSASPDCYMNAWLGLLPIDEVLASPTDDKGRVSRTVRFHEKVKRMREWEAAQTVPVDWQESWAYGDSATDLPVMRLCGHPVLVNPKPAMLEEGAGLPREDWRA